MKNSNLGKLYNEYLTRSDTEIHIDGKRYVRILYSEFISVADREFLIAYIPSILNFRTDDTVQDKTAINLYLKHQYT